ncbi:16S rRNA (cytosine(1402)-N(4))-methyltransferase RsmH [Vulgatibacter sp.]|uniref:16S rRNA (cytosine(1402)-N(4))-methyltransferase RsmH n=1 Tax=Vulgatibacter sp. TaxID=1971226 RepID=UPI003561A5E2
MENAPHLSVLPRETIDVLAVRPDVVVVDGTLGYGGHTELLLQAGARVIGLDRDPRAIAAAEARLAPFGDRFRAVQANFRDIRAVLDELGIDEVDGALVDLGVSSPQLDVAERGFSFRNAGPLDMRMGEDAPTLAEYLAGVDDRELKRVISWYGEERFAGPVAKAIKRELHRISDTVQLAEVVSNAIPRGAWPKGIHPATRTFQGLRIAVNDELGALDAWLQALPAVIAKGGRAAAISFHSLEDRAVKQGFTALAHPCRCPPGMPVCICGAAEWKLVTRKAIVPTEEEIARNPRSRSSKLRAVERL